MAKFKVYLAKLKRRDRKPTTVYKVGITQSSDAMRRLLYNGPDEPFPISKAFTDIKIMKTVWCSCEEEALALEQQIMDNIKGSDKYFHNWYEPDQLSGITEMRTWNYEEVQRIFKMMEDHNEKDHDRVALESSQSSSN